MRADSLEFFSFHGNLFKHGLVESGNCLMKFDFYVWTQFRQYFYKNGIIYVFFFSIWLA